MLRDFEPGDQGAVRRLVLDGLRERWGEVFDPGRNRDLDDIAASFVDRGAQVVVIESGGALVATGTLVTDGTGVGRIVRMSVAATHRRQGLGRRVVAELVDRARRGGMREVRVLTDTPWTSAVALYRACGFIEVDADERDTHFVMLLGPP